MVRKKDSTAMPGRVRRAIATLGNAVRQLDDIRNLRHTDPRTEYHAIEYIDEMEDLLLQQLITATADRLEREDILISCGLDYLLVRLDHMATEWEKDF